MKSGKKKAPERIGIFGGTFDPPHIGHLIIAETARTQLELDRVVFIPANIPPHKRRANSSSPRNRLAMVRLAVAGSPAFIASDLEIRRAGISYTVDTLKALNFRLPRSRFYLLMGSDNAGLFHTWKLPEEITRWAVLVVYGRRGASLRKTLAGMKVVSLRGPFLEISSSDIRELVHRGTSIRYLVPARVERFIHSRGLYKRK